MVVKKVEGLMSPKHVTRKKKLTRCPLIIQVFDLDRRRGKEGVRLHALLDTVSQLQFLGYAFVF